MMPLRLALCDRLEQRVNVRISPCDNGTHRSKAQAHTRKKICMQRQRDTERVQQM